METKEKQCFSYTFALDANEWDKKKLEKIFKVEYHAYSLAFSYYYKQLEAYRNEELYKEIVERHKKLFKDSEEFVPYTKEEKDTLKELQKKHELFGSRPSAVLAKRLRRNFKETLDANMIQFAIDNVYKGVQNVLFTKDTRTAAKKAKGLRRIHKNKYQEFTTIGMYTNISGCVIKKKEDGFYLDYKQTGRKGKLKFCIKIKTKTGKEKIDEMLEFHEIKYPVLKRVRTKKGWKYQVQILFDGVPSRDNLKSVDKIVGCNITEGHIAVVTDDLVVYQKLYSVDDSQLEKVTELSQKMDEVQRRDNPENYNADGTISKGRKKWKHSKEYITLRNTKKVLEERNVNKLIYKQNCLANAIANLGNDIRIVKKDFNFKKIKKEETTIDENGRYEDKSSLSAKPIQNNAPARLVDKIGQRNKYINGSFTKVSDKDEGIYVLDIFSGEKLPYTIDDEYYMIDNRRIHRTVYYAYVMTGYNIEEKRFDYHDLSKRFDSFYELYLKNVDTEGNIKETVLA